MESKADTFRRADYQETRGTPLGAAIDRLAEADPAAECVVCGEVRLTRAEFARRSTAMARHLARLGAGWGSFITIDTTDGVQCLEATAAAWKLGAVPLPVSAGLPVPELRGLLSLIDCAAVVGLDPQDGHSWLPRAWQAPATAGHDPLPPVIGPAGRATSTSGSTGTPKIVVDGYPATREAATMRALSIRLRGSGVLFCTFPLDRTSSFTFSCTMLALGGKIVLTSSFDARQALAIAERERVTSMLVSPPRLHALVSLPEPERAKADLSSVKTLLHLSAPCSQAVKRACINWLGAGRVFEVYTATELPAGTLISGSEWLAHPGSVGRGAGTTIRVLGPGGDDLPAGQVGEVWLQRPRGMRPFRYIGWQPRQRGDWITVGDLGWLDSGGYLYLAGRGDDMVIVDGMNVYPAEVESVLEDHPGVQSCCVIGLPDDDHCSRLHAIVQAAGHPAGGEPAAHAAGEPAAHAAGELIAHTVGKLAGYKVPRSIEFTDKPLRDELGKIRRRALREARIHREEPQ